jgi:hypothetical protein
VIEKRLVTVSQLNQINVTVKIGELEIELLFDALRLPCERLDRVRKQTLKPVLSALLDGEAVPCVRTGSLSRADPSV